MTINKRTECAGCHLKKLHNRNKDKKANFRSTRAFSTDFRGIKPRSYNLGR